MRLAAKWQLYRNYLFLVPVFVIACIYQASLITVAIRGALFPRQVAVQPFWTEGRIVQVVGSQASLAGLHSGDRILALDGVDFRNLRVFSDRFNQGAKRPLAVTVTESQNALPRTIVIPLKATSTRADSIWEFLTAIIVIVMSLGCTAVGVYVAAVLPYDLRAIAVLGMMISVSQIVTSESWNAFPGLIQGFAFEYQIFGITTWPLWLVLFGLYFPHRFPWDLRRPWLKWLLLLPTIVAVTDFSITAGRHYFNNDAFSWLPVINGRLLLALAIVVFFFCIFSKLRQTESADAKRRLRVLFGGALLGLVPAAGFVAYQVVRPSPDSGELAAVVLVVACLFFLFPLSLAYVVLAERAMNVRMVVRQSLRYALAKGGLRILTGCLLAAVISALWNLTFGWKVSDYVRIGVFVLAAIVTSRILRRTSQRLRRALDRRFFRDAYNAEKVLEELSRKVISLMSKDDLLKTVTHRIADTLHVAKIAVLLEENGEFRPAYAFGMANGAAQTKPLLLEAKSSTLQMVERFDEPQRIYFERRDNWVHDLPDRDVDALKQMQSQLLLPMGAQGRLLGLVSLGPKLSEEPYSESDVHLLTSVMAQTGLALENSRLASAIATEVAQRERQNREMEIAREVQERLFPQRLTAVAGIDYAGACRPALGVGGDYYDFLNLPDGQLGIAIGDISGKGIAAALLMASLQASLRSQVMTNAGDLARLMANVNQLVYEATPENRYATFFYGQLDVRTRALNYVNAGHNPPLVIRRSAAGATHVLHLDTGGPVVGLIPGAPYQQGTVLLEPGDIFIGYTDGISEAMNNQDDEWGEDRLIIAVAESSTVGATALIPAIMRGADTFADGAPQHDDMTLVVLKLLGQQTPS